MVIQINLTGEEQVGELVDVVTNSPRASDKLKEEMCRIEQEWFGVDLQLQLVEET